MQVAITPGLLSGTLPAIPSKSDAHRLLICAALADRPTKLILPQSSADLDATITCLCALGACVQRTGESITVTPVQTPADFPLLDCGESGSTFRFLLPVAAAVCSHVRFAGRGRLPDRPIGDLMDAMKEHSVHFSADRLPFEMSGGLTGGEFHLPGNISSQYITGLLLALPKAQTDSTLHLTTRLESAAYVEMTLYALKRFGVKVLTDSTDWKRFIIPGGQSYTSPGTVCVDSDWSNAAFFLAAGALGKPVAVSGLDVCSTQGDRAVLDLLCRFGAEIELKGDTALVKPGDLHGCEIDISEVPDLLPVLAVVAAFAKGETRFVNAARLRLKESDRLASTAALLTALGGDVKVLPEGLIVRGGQLTGGTVDSFHDHRIAMAAAIAAIRCAGPVIITDAGAVEKSYPAFFADYQKIGGKIHVL